MKQTFKIPVTWEVSGVVEIEAESLDEAIATFDRTEPEIGLPYSYEYIDGSFRREDEEFVAEYNHLESLFQKP